MLVLWLIWIMMMLFIPLLAGVIVVLRQRREHQNIQLSDGGSHTEEQRVMITE